MRARQMRANLRSLALLGAEAHAEVLRRIDPSIVRHSESAGRLAWLPLEYDVALSAAVLDVVGYEASIRWAHDGLMAAVDGPLMQNLIRPAARLFASDPATVARILPRVMAATLRNCGTYRVEVANASLVYVVGQAVPDIMRELPLYLQGLGDSFALLFDFVGFQATVHVQPGEGDDVVWSVGLEPASGRREAS